MYKLYDSMALAVSELDLINTQLGYPDPAMKTQSAFDIIALPSGKAAVPNNFWIEGEASIEDLLLEGYVLPPNIDMGT